MNANIDFASIIADVIAQESNRHAKDNPTLVFPKAEGVDISPAEKRIGLPEGETVEQAIKTLVEYKDGLEQDVAIVRQFNARLEDLQVAVATIAETVWGTTGKGKMMYSFFGGATPPQMVNVTIGLDSHGRKLTKTVAASTFTLQPLNAELTYGYWDHQKVGTCGMIQCKTLKQYEGQIKKFFDQVEEYLKTNSIYKNKVIEFKKNPSGEGYELDFKFMKADPNIVYNEDTAKELEFSVFGPLRLASKIGKIQKETFNVILWGPYGSGKTECTLNAAQVAVEHGQTAVFFTPTGNETSADLEAAKHVAALYGPSILVVEDVERYFQDIDNPQKKAFITSILDGADKGSGVSILSTTNHVDAIPAGISRSGRTDDLLEIGYLNRVATEKLFRQLLGDELESDVDFDSIYEAVEGTGPSFIRSTFDRARRNSIITNNGELGHKLTTDDLLYAAMTRRRNSEFHMKTKTLSLAERLEKVTREKHVIESEIIGDEMRDKRDAKEAKQVDELHQRVVG